MSLQNLTRWGGALLELSQYGNLSERRELLRGIVTVCLCLLVPVPCLNNAASSKRDFFSLILLMFSMVKQNVEAVSKLEEALAINPVNHEALWRLGKAHICCGLITSDNGEAELLFHEAFQCLQKAVNEVYFLAHAYNKAQ